jgi:1-acyl-sn-glycerol-3-phosphate acyltransferase
VLKGLAGFILRLGGWTAVGLPPDVPKAVFVAAPHTSNWDGIWGLVYAVSVDLEIKFFAKKTLFWFPLSAVLHWLGGIPLNRSKAGSAVAQAVAMFESREQFFFALAPEGTRSRTSGWKSGFYRIAKEAKVPVFFGILDYGNKRIGIDGHLDLSGDEQADMKVLAAFYEPIDGRWPELASPVRFT